MRECQVPEELDDSDTRMEWHQNRQSLVTFSTGFLRSAKGHLDLLAVESLHVLWKRLYPRFLVFLFPPSGG